MTDIDDAELRDQDPFDLLDREFERLDGYLATLEGDDWLEPTRCEGWRRRELLAHLASSEGYNRATIDGTVGEFMAQGAAVGATDLDSFNAWGVRELDDSEPEELLEMWRERSGRNRRDLRAMGWDGVLQTAGAGPYAAGRQALHLAQEFAIHADDMGMPVSAAEREFRRTWQPRFARFTLREYGKEVEVESDGRGGNTVKGAATQVTLDDDTLVAVCSARLPDDANVPAQLRGLLRVFA